MPETEPYLWRYREQFDDGGEMDILLLMGQDSIADERGELTIIYWD